MRTSFSVIIILVFILLSIFLLPWNAVNWGRISILPAATITVTGQAQANQKNQIASFNASVTSTNQDKGKAVDETNTKMTSLINSLKSFGIPADDIKTESINVYQMATSLPVPQTGGAQTLIYPVPPQRTGSGDWQASNSITITLRDLTKAPGLTDLLNKSGASNIYGPNLTIDNANKDDSSLLTKAIEDARIKANEMAKAGGSTLGKMINVQEGAGSYPMPLYATKDASSGSSPIEPGTSTLYKSVTVVFELR